MRFLISGGPTHEFLDDVRYLGNPSSGALGIALAEAARDAGHAVTLVLGPTHLPDPAGVEVVRVVSALEMHEALTSRVGAAGAVVMTAAVSDYRPKSRVEGKIKKGAQELVLELVKNPDILGELGKMGRDRVLVGFALEAAPPEEARELARGKLAAKNLDLVVLNRRGSFGGAGMEDVTAIARSGEVTELGAVDKASLAAWLVAWCAREGGNDQRGEGST